MATQTQYYNLDKPSYDEVADIEIINANMDKIDQQMRNNADGVNFAKGISSDAYDNSKLYAVGDYCIYDNKLYRCIIAIESAEAFNIAKWEQTTIVKEVKQLNSNLATKNITSQLAYNKDVVSDLRVLRTGNVVEVYFVVNADSNKLNIISGLPKSASRYSTCPVFNNVSPYKPVDASVRISNNIIHLYTSSQITDGSVSLIYICE